MADPGNAPNDHPRLEAESMKTIAECAAIMDLDMAVIAWTQDDTCKRQEFDRLTEDQRQEHARRMLARSTAGTPGAHHAATV